MPVLTLSKKKKEKSVTKEPEKKGKKKKVSRESVCIRQLNGDVTDAGQATSKGNGRLGHFHLVSRRSFYFPPFSMTSSLLPPVFHLLLLLPKSSWRTPTFREEPCPRHYSSSSTLSLEKKIVFLSLYDRLSNAKSQRAFDWIEGQIGAC